MVQLAGGWRTSGLGETLKSSGRLHEARKSYEKLRVLQEERKRLQAVSLGLWKVRPSFGGEAHVSYVPAAVRCSRQPFFSRAGPPASR